MGSTSDHWSETPWNRRDDLCMPMWHKSQVPYVQFPNKLQHLDVWAPAKHAPGPEDVPASWLPDSHALWVIYIHGGAWRDPLVTSESLVPTLKNLSPAWLASRKAPVIFASVNYSLSPYPSHPTEPSDPSDDSRNASHPQHVLDVLEAISFLQKRAGFKDKYILVGHSCGATLAFQAAMKPTRWGISMARDFSIEAPLMVLGFNGLYDMPELAENPGGAFDEYRPFYEQFTRNAFGNDDKHLWKSISPAWTESWATEWPGGRRVMLVQSPEDELVPYNQAERMKDCLFSSKADKLVVEMIDGVGCHEDVWQKGTSLAKFLTRAIDDVSGLL